MIIKTFTPRNKTNDPYFRYELPFDGDTAKTYSCNVIGSNMPTPKFIGFTTRMINNIPQNYMILEFEARCNNVQVTIEFMTESEAVEEKKVKFITWIAGYFTWFNFLFRIFSLKTLKRATIVIATLIFTPVAVGLLYAGADWACEEFYGVPLDETEFMQKADDFRYRKFGQYFREDAINDAEEFGGFIKEKISDAKEAVSDKIEDIVE